LAVLTDGQFLAATGSSVPTRDIHHLDNREAGYGAEQSYSLKAYCVLLGLRSQCHQLNQMTGIVQVAVNDRLVGYGTVFRLLSNQTTNSLPLSRGTNRAHNSNFAWTTFMNRVQCPLKCDHLRCLSIPHDANTHIGAETRSQMTAIATSDCAELASKLGAEYVSGATREHRKSHGQFMTPIPIATEMARGMLEKKRTTVRILEPAAGSGILVAELVEQIAKLENRPSAITIAVYELEPALVECLHIVCRALQQKCRLLGIKFRYSVHHKDFLLENIHGKFDIIISNPPYFKLRKDDPRSLAHRHVVYGQPNIYSLFMARCASLLKDCGNLCFLTPRSWTSGPYFVELRRFINRHLKIDAIHLFENRTSHFPGEVIQQEAMILWASSKQTVNDEVLLSVSNGLADLDRARLNLVSSKDIFPNDHHSRLVIPAFSRNVDALPWEESLITRGLRASTGKVVPFRSKQFILNAASSSSVPLFWLQHVKRQITSWPLGIQSEHILCDDKSNKLLIVDANYVFVRRLSCGNKAQAITAAPYFASGGSKIGIENHLNYIHKPDGKLTATEVRGLSAYLNSELVNRYFFARLGHTQVNATDLNNLPVPPLEKLAVLGETLNTIDEIGDIESAIETLLLAEHSQYFTDNNLENIN